MPQEFRFEIKTVEHDKLSRRFNVHGEKQTISVPENNIKGRTYDEQRFKLQVLKYSEGAEAIGIIDDDGRIDQLQIGNIYKPYIVDSKNDTDKRHLAMLNI